MTLTIALLALLGDLILAAFLIMLLRENQFHHDRLRALEGEPVFGSDNEAEEHNWNIRQDWYSDTVVSPR